MLIFSSGVYSWWLNSWFHLFIFLSRSSKFSQLYRHEDPSKSLQGFILCFQLLFIFVILFVYWSSSWRFYMRIHKGFNSFSKFSSRFFCKEFKLSFFLLSGVQFFLPYHWRWYYAILDNLSSCFVIQQLSRMR